ncbi:STAS domain-containing protein [Litchfieldia salsa]|uniref:Anti-sigma factor antagonist n=1 Tax=Litchfieldia salsa TaxID=930152 RepID=A0A1H0USI7_9BACI|nr:STAS domain-containing protein [Litchfieldia salsa]SDP69147.1 anti-anti-sigma factor [Litchfieldia salsa]
MKTVLEHRIEEGTIIIEISGKLQYNQSESVKGKLIDFIQEGKFNYIFDLSNLENIDSTGMGLFITFMNHIENKESKIYLVIKDEFIKELFEIAKLDQLFVIDTSVENVMGKLVKKENGNI